MRKIACIILIAVFLFIAIGTFFIPIADTEEWTENYNLYKELKDYKNISELEEHLNSKRIKHERKNDNIYIYLKDDNKYADVIFDTIETECKIQTSKYDINFQKLDERKNVKVYKKGGVEYISRIEDGVKYEYSDGKYYITWLKALWIRWGVIILSLANAVFWAWLIFTPRKKEG